MHVIKIGLMYVSFDGSLTSDQHRALRVDLSSVPQDAGTPPRAVKLTPKRHDLPPMDLSNGGQSPF